MIQLTDDEKFLWKDMTLEEANRLCYENAKDIIAVGFNPDKTFIFADTEYIGHMYPLILNIQKRVTQNQARGIFGFGGSDNIGKMSFPAIQAAPSFSTAFPVVLKGVPDMPCLIPCAIDQDPYFRMTRDVAARMGLSKPALIHAKFFPALQGAKTKMSASDSSTSIYVDDKPDQILEKVKKYAFSGGGETLELHRLNGADLDVDIPYQWLRFFLDDDEKLAHIAEEYGSGRMMTGEIKSVLADILIVLVQDFQEKRKTVTSQVVAEFMKIRPLTF